MLALLVFSFGCGGGNNKSTASNITVLVVESETNSPLQGVDVQMGNADGTTDSSGKVTFSGIEASNYTISASKDGFDSATQDIDVAEGKDQSVKMVLAKTSTSVSSDKLKELKDLKSYMFVLKTTEVNGTVESLITIEVNNNGNEEKMISVDSSGKTDIEIYVVGNKALMGTPGSYNEFDPEAAKQYIESLSMLGQNYMDGFTKSYDDFIASPNLYATWKTSTEAQNGYSTTKVEYTIHSGTVEAVYTGWVINKGEYKDYTTRLLIENNSTDAKPTDMKTMDINITKIGEKFDIRLP
ncbi:MAG: carboxypeptidase-like regulatory domain-containing protein [Caldisericaceae bacterium]